MSETSRGSVAEFRVDSAFAADALTTMPTVVLELDRTTVLDDGRATFLVWAHGVDSDRREFERALAADDTVANAVRVASPAEARVPYRVEALLDPSFSSLLAGAGTVLLDAIGSQDGWDVRVLVPDRAALAAYDERCREQGVGLDLKRLYDPNDADERTDRGLTDSQRAMLVRAFESGYFDVPRSTTLDDLATEFDISGQSASERLRRGMTTLLAAHLETGRGSSSRSSHEPADPSDLRSAT